MHNENAFEYIHHFSNLTGVYNRKQLHTLTFNFFTLGHLRHGLPICGGTAGPCGYG